MYPFLFGVKTYSFLYCLSLLAHVALAIAFCRQMGLSRRAGMWIGMCYIFGMAVGARILYDLLHGQFAAGNYLNLRYYFGDGLWGGPLAYLAVATTGILLLGRDKRGLMDVMVLALPAPMILAKTACFFNGCCFGAATKMPWGVAFPEGAEAPAGVSRHPTQLYEILVLAAIVLALQMLDRDRWRGRLVFWFVGLYGLGRPVTEFFRAPEECIPRVGRLSDSQVACLVAAVASGVVLLVVRARRGMRGDQAPSAA